MVVDLTKNLAKCATDNAEKGCLLDSVADRSEAVRSSSKAALIMPHSAIATVIRNSHFHIHPILRAIAIRCRKCSDM